jgi:1A family penicillin-binding protein
MKNPFKHYIKVEKRDLWTALIGILVVTIAVPILTYIYFARDLTSKEGVMNRKDTGVTLLDIKGRPFFTFFDAKNKSFVPLSEIPKQTQQAVIAMEDKDFYSHPGFSIKAMMRSLFLDLTKKELAYGGSTITQQLVKNSLLTPKKSFLRKYQELILAQEIERRFSKEEILEMYLNSVYFGEGAFGIEEASQTYFDTHASQLNLAQSAILVGILTSPSSLSPISGDLDEANLRKTIVLQKMFEQKYITKDQQEQAINIKLVFVSAKDQLNSLAPHFALMVRSELIDKYGEEQISRSGFKVQTTLDIDWQRYAEEVIKDQVEKLKANRVTNGSTVVLDPRSGEIRALVGSKDWYDDQFGKLNIVTANRPPGSSFKPIVYSLAMEKKLITAATVLKDEPITYEVKGSAPYKPQNYDRKFRGPVLTRRSLANSLNVPSVEVMNKVGVQPVLDFSKQLGITTLADASQYGLSLVLGTGDVKLLELANAYATFASGGYKKDATTIFKIEDKFGNSIYTHVPDSKKIISEGTSFIISSILSDKATRAEVFGNALNISRPAAVKTGTTEDYKDAWTVGYTPSLVIGVWVGNNDNQPMDQIAGSLGAAPIWRALMERFLQGTPIEQFKRPGEIVAVSICKNNGLLLKEKVSTDSASIEYFLPGTEPKKLCNLPKPENSSDSANPSLSPSPASSTPDNNQDKNDKAPEKKEDKKNEESN